MISYFNDETNFPHKLLITNRQAANLGTAFANKTSVNIKLSEPQLSRKIQNWEFLARLPGPYLKTELSLMKNLIS